MHWPLVLEVMGSIPTAGEEKFWCPAMLSLVSFAEMTLNKCAVQGEPSHVQVKEHYSTLHDYL